MLSKEYILGFVEGEGCFSIAIGKNIDRKPRKNPGRKNRIKNPCLFIVKPGFRITNCDLPILTELKETFGFGSIQIQDRAKKNPNFRVSGHFYTKNLEETVKVRDYFKDCVFHTGKGKDYLIWCSIIELILAKRHLTKEGLLEICRLRDQMNQRVIKKKWTTEEVEKVLNEKPLHVQSHFDQNQALLIHNNSFDLTSWLVAKQGNNHRTSSSAKNLTQNT